LGFEFLLLPSTSFVKTTKIRHDMNAVITGASRGIGKALAETYALHGYNLYLCSKTEANLLATIEELKTAYPNVTIDGQAMDLGKKEKAKLFGEWVLNNADSVDVLINNTGTFIQGNVSDEPDGALEEMLEVNLFSAYHTTRAIVPRMKTRKQGHIFTICSIASLAAYPGGGAYGISKYALLGFTRNLRHELKEHGVKVTAVISGAVYTDSWKGSGVAENRIMETEDLAKMIFAASQLSPQAVVEDIVMRPQLGDL
jgi:short-subunit dehydrogenase